MTYEPMHSAQAQRVTEKISFLFVGHHCRDIIRNEDKYIFSPFLRVNSLRFQLKLMYSDVNTLGQGGPRLRA